MVKHLKCVFVERFVEREVWSELSVGRPARMDEPEAASVVAYVYRGG